MTIEVKRLYAMSDAVMLEKASVMHNAFVAALPDFTAYSTHFDQTFADDWMAEIMLALQTPTAEQVGDMGSDYTQTVLEKMAECRHAYRGIKFFVKEAFASNVGVQNEFGFDDFRDVRTNQQLLVYFMLRLHMTALKYSAKLLSAGCSQARIDSLQTHANELLTASVEQEAFLKNSLDTTVDRITLLNSVWKQMSRISEVGKIINHKNYAGYQKYVIYDRKPPVDKEEVFEGVLQGGEVLQIFSKPYDSSRVLMLGNPGNVPVEYFLSKNGTDPPGLVALVNPGDLISYSIVNDNGKEIRLLVRNTDMVSVGEFSCGVASLNPS